MFSFGDIGSKSWEIIFLCPLKYFRYLRDLKNLLLTCSLIFPYYQGDPTIFNKVLLSQLDNTFWFEGLLIFHTLLNYAWMRELKKNLDKKVGWIQ